MISIKTAEFISYDKKFKTFFWGKKMTKKEEKSEIENK